MTVRAGAVQGVVGTGDRVTMSAAVEVTLGHELQMTVVLTVMSELAAASEAVRNDYISNRDLHDSKNNNAEE